MGKKESLEDILSKQYEMQFELAVGFLSFSTIAIWTILFGGGIGVYPMYCSVFNRIPDFFIPDASSIAGYKNQKFLQTLSNVLGRAKCLRLRDEKT